MGWAPPSLDPTSMDQIATTTAPTATSRVETRKRAQRHEMLAAARELARRGGYDAVQMRQIADAVGMSPGSVYNYFQSKDHLLSALMVEWTKALADQVDRRPPQGATTAERIVDVLDRARRGVAAERNLAEAVLAAVRHHARATADPGDSQEIGDHLHRALASAFPADFPEQDRDEILMILSQVWYAALIGWVAGWVSADEMHERMAVTASRLTIPYEDGLRRS